VLEGTPELLEPKVLAFTLELEPDVLFTIETEKNVKISDPRNRLAGGGYRPVVAIMRIISFRVVESGVLKGRFVSLRQGFSSRLEPLIAKSSYLLADTVFFFREKSFFIHCESGYLAFTRLFSSLTAFLDSVHLSAIAKSALTSFQPLFR
jgi:hypothetical protein